MQPGQDPEKNANNILGQAKVQNMKTREVRDRIKKNMQSFVRKDPRKFPDLAIHILSRTRPSGLVYLIRGDDWSKQIESFNSIAELGVIIETVCREYRAKSP